MPSPPERNRLKVTLLLIAIVLGVAAAAATIEGQHELIINHQREAERRQNIHASLGELIARGDAILQALATNQNPIDINGLNNWAKTAEDYISKTLGSGCVARFRDGSGIVHGEPIGADQAHVRYWNPVYERVARLQQFSGELPP